MLKKILRGVLPYILLVPAILFYIFEQQELYLEFIHSTLGWTIFFISLISGVSLIFGPMVLNLVTILIGYFITKRVLKIGRPVSGVITDIGETDRGVITVNDQPYIEIDVEVHDSVRGVYPVSFKSIVPRVAIPGIQPGEEIPLKVHPKYPYRVAIDWERF